MSAGIDPTKDPVVGGLITRLKESIKGKLIEAARASGTIPTQQTHLQAEMLTGIAVYALLAEVQVMTVQHTDSQNVIDSETARLRGEGSAETYFETVARPEMASAFAEALMGNGIMAISEVSGDNAVSWFGKIVLLAAGPAPTSKPAPAGRLVLPGLGR